MEVVLLKKNGSDSYDLIERTALNNMIENQISTFITEENEKVKPLIEDLQNDSKAQIEVLQNDLKSSIEALQKELQEKIEALQKTAHEKIKTINDNSDSSIKEINDAKSAKIEQFRNEVNAEAIAATIASLDRISLGQLQVPFSEMKVISDPFIKTITMPFSTDELAKIEKGEVIEAKTYDQKMIKLKHTNSEIEVEIPLT